MNIDVKSALESKTIMAGAVAILSGILGVWGYHIDAPLQGDIVNLIAPVGALVGGIGAIWGRIKATKQIVSVLPK